MNRRSSIALSLGALALVALTACGSKSSSSSVSPGVAPIHAVTVHGIGQVDVTPDVLVLNMAAEATATSAGAALSKAGKASDALVKVLKSNKVKDKDIQTTQVYLTPQYDYSLNKTPTITGYQASVGITAKIHDVSAVSDILDEASTAAGDALRLNGLAWDIDDPSSALSKAREAAVKDAAARAAELAKAAGAKLGAVISINESSQSTVPRPIDATAAGDKAAGAAIESIAVQSGSQTVSVNVDVVYSLG